MVRSLSLVLSMLLGTVGCRSERLPAAEQDSPEPTAPETKAQPSRCQAIGRDEVLGAKSEGDVSLDQLLPFATEVGGGVAMEGGFAVGALRQAGSGTTSVVVATNRDATVWRTISVGASHGDSEAPRVFARGGFLGLSVLEPAGASRILRLARIDRDTVHWAAELPQGTDESLAFDVALGATKGVVVWDDVLKGRKVSSIVLSTVDAATLKNPSKPIAVTSAGTDAEMPRVVERDGGFWLFWLVRRSLAGRGVSMGDMRYEAEGIDQKWIEAVPLDAVGGVVGKPVRLGSSDGHVLAYGVASVGDDAAVVVWRDDDTPSGSAGGQLLRVRVRLGGLDGPEPVDDEYAGAGAPRVMPGWFSMADATGVTRLSPMASDGSLLDRLEPEPLLGAGEPMAVHGDDILVSRPDGLAARLFVVRCRRDVLYAPGQDAGEPLAP